MSINTVYDNYQTNLISASSITGLGQQIIDIAVSSLSNIEKYSRENSTKIALKNQIQMLRKLYDSPALDDILPNILRQQIVLIVSSFEAYMADLVRYIGNNCRSLLIWPEDKPGKIDLSLLNSETSTLGDVVLSVIEERGTSFQDLKSTKNFFTHYLGTELSLSEEDEDIIILVTALRHVIVHSNNKIDRRFLKQVRNTRFQRMYKLNDEVKPTEKEIRDYMNVFRKLGKKIHNELKTKTPEEETAQIE